MSHKAKIGVTTAVFIGMSAMIGAGIFTAPATLAVYVGPAGIIAYLFVVLAVWFLAQSFARLAALFPQGGSFYTFTKQWAGHTVGLITAATYLVGLLVAMGLLVQLAGNYLAPLVHLPPFSLGLGILATLVILNLFGSASAQLGIVLNIITVFCLVSITGLCLTKVSLSNLFPFAPHGLANVFKATKVVIFGFFGFEAVTSLANVVEDPQKNIPRATTYAVLAVAALYIAFISSVLLSTPASFFSSAKEPLSETLKLLVPHATWFITIIQIGILSSLVGCVYAIIYSASNLLLDLFAHVKNSAVQAAVKTGKLNHRVAVFLTASIILASFLCVNDINLFFSLTAILIVFSYIMAIIALLFIKSEWDSGQNYKTLIGLSTGFIIFVFAVQGLLEILSNSGI